MQGTKGETPCAVPGSGVLPTYDAVRDLIAALRHVLTGLEMCASASLKLLTPEQRDELTLKRLITRQNWCGL